MIDRFAKIIVEVKKILRTSSALSSGSSCRRAAEGMTLDSMSLSRSALPLSLALTATVCVHESRFSNCFFSGTILLRQKIFLNQNAATRSIRFCKRYRKIKLSLNIIFNFFTFLFEIHSFSLLFKQ